MLIKINLISKLLGVHKKHIDSKIVFDKKTKEFLLSPKTKYS